MKPGSADTLLDIKTQNSKYFLGQRYANKTQNSKYFLGQRYANKTQNSKLKTPHELLANEI